MLFLCTPEEKARVIEAAELALMKPTAILINASRGSNVNEAALHAALSTGRLYGAGLDTYEKEPKERGGQHNRVYEKISHS